MGVEGAEIANVELGDQHPETFPPSKRPCVGGGLAALGATEAKTDAAKGEQKIEAMTGPQNKDAVQEENLQDKFDAEEKENIEKFGSPELNRYSKTEEFEPQKEEVDKFTVNLDQEEPKDTFKEEGSLGQSKSESGDKANAKLINRLNAHNEASEKGKKQMELHMSLEGSKAAMYADVLHRLYMQHAPEKAHLVDRNIKKELSSLKYLHPLYERVCDFYKVQPMSAFEIMAAWKAPGA